MLFLLISRSRVSILRLTRARSDLRRPFYRPDYQRVKAATRLRKRVEPMQRSRRSVGRVSALDAGRQLAARDAAAQLVHFSILGRELRPAGLLSSTLARIAGAAILSA